MKYYQTWQGSIAGSGSFFPAAVPGNIQYDWAQAQGFADSIMHSDTARRFEAVEDVTWEYRTNIEFTSEPGQRVFFVAEGVDYYCDIKLDGRLLASHEGSYTRIEADITDIAKNGSLLQVIVYPHPMTAGKEFGRENAARSVKAPCTYGWDWNPRLIISGIWKPACIETRDKGYIRSAEPFYTLNSSLDRAEVRFDIDCDEETLITLTDPEGNVVYAGSEPCFTVENVKLWWCAGHGEPSLYAWSVKSGSCERTGAIGFRTVRLVMNTGADLEPVEFPKGRYPAPATVELNGRRIFAKGSNWVNPELFFGRITGERYQELLDAVKAANMNILRLWGGSGFKKDEFYDICDRLGIMLWQEFPLACNNYPDDEHYLRILEQEASFSIKALRRHPSIIMWCGGNELFNNWSGMNDQSLALRLLNKLCYELDRSRAFLATSPLFGMRHGTYVFDDGDQSVFEMFQNSKATAYCEFGVSGAANIESIKEIIPESELFPIERTPAWLYHHAFEAWEDQRWLCPDTLDKYFGTLSSLEDTIRASQLLQNEGYKAIFEEARRQWPYCSMAINWCFNEPWITAANNSLISWPLVKKPAYYAVSGSLEPVLPSARIPHISWKRGEIFTAEIWLLNDSDNAAGGTIRAQLLINGSACAENTYEAGKLASMQNAMLGSFTCELPEVSDADEFVLKLSMEGCKDHEYTLLLR